MVLAVQRFGISTPSLPASRWIDARLAPPRSPDYATIRAFFFVRFWADGSSS